MAIQHHYRQVSNRSKEEILWQCAAIYTKQLEPLLFAGDLVMLAECEDAMQHNLQELNDRLDEWEMKANWQKTRVMRVGRKHGICNVKVNEERVEQVKEMKYLGTMISSDGSMDSEV